MIRDLAIFGQATYLKVPRRQFYCHNCQRYFTESLSSINEGRHYTRRYEEPIYQQVQLSSIEQVSRAEGLSFDRIQGIFKHQYAQKKRRITQILYCCFQLWNGKQKADGCPLIANPQNSPETNANATHVFHNTFLSKPFLGGSHQQPQVTP
ncbi:MAG: hypothetical protein KME42_16935 [Tildeniella nuda ZEHNDER 1965/U140]|nr:hypothetical protein [Tildeniella nuda ZEHNDER 1965/U140]